MNRLVFREKFKFLSPLRDWWNRKEDDIIQYKSKCLLKYSNVNQFRATKSWIGTERNTKNQSDHFSSHGSSTNDDLIRVWNS